MKNKKMLIVFFIIFFSLLLVNIHHLEETVLISFNSFIWLSTSSIFCAYIIGGFVLFVSVLFDFVCLIVSYLLLTSVLVLPIILYNLTSISLTDIIIGTFIYNLIICIPYIYLSSNWVKDLKIGKSIRYLLIFAYACGYILLNIIYVYVIRYIRLGNDIDVFSLISVDLNYLMIVIFLIPYLWIWIYMFIFRVIQLRWDIWYQIEARLYYIHLYWLRYDKYFSFIEKIFKLSYIWRTFVCNYSDIYLNTGKIRKMIHRLYIHPFITPLIILIICLFEIILRGGYLKYGIYLLIIYLMLRPIITTINTFSMSEWAGNIAKADYIAGKWSNPRYYEYFWMKFPSTREYFQNQPQVDEDILNACYIKSKEIGDKFWSQTYKLTENILNKTIDLSKMRFKNRLKLGYFNSTHVRWMHTERVVNRPGIWHPMTSFFARKATDFGALLNNHWSHYAMIEKFNNNKIPYQNDIKYNHFDTPNVKSISAVSEHNLITNFKGLLSRNIKLSGYNKNLHLDSHNQARDDIVIDLREAQYPVIDHRVHGLDQKATTNVRDPSSKIFSQINEIDYREFLRNHGELIKSNYALSEQEKFQIDSALHKLGQQADNFENQQKVWTEIVHLFPNKYIPPMRIPHNFSQDDLIPSVKKEMERSNVVMSRVSERLYFYRVPCDYREAIEYFEDSFIQKIFRESEY